MEKEMKTKKTLDEDLFLWIDDDYNFHFTIRAESPKTRIWNMYRLTKTEIETAEFFLKLGQSMTLELLNSVAVSKKNEDFMKKGNK